MRERLRRIVLAVLQGFRTHRLPFLAAAVAYHVLFSVVPAMVIILFLLGKVLTRETALAQVQGFLTERLGAETAAAFTGMIGGVQGTQLGATTWILIAAILAYSATRLFINLQHGLNTIWETRAEGGGVQGFLKRRLLSFAMLLLIGALILALFLVNAFLSGIAAASALPGAAVGLLYYLGSALCLGILFAVIYRSLPETDVSWHDALVGGLFVAPVFLLGSRAVVAYLRIIDPTSAYGAASSLVLFMLWTYYLILIVLLGGEFTAAYGKDAREGKKQVRRGP